MEHKHYGVATAGSSSSGAGTSVVKRMMESGLFSASLAHRVSASEVDMDIGGTFILDGEAFPAGRYVLEEGPQINFVVP